MRTIAQTPTEPLDYAAITATYSALLGTLLLAAKTNREGTEAVVGGELLPLGAATFALAKLVGQEKVETWVRTPFLEERADGEREPRGRGLRYAIGELMSCTRCLGAWSALGLVALRINAPAPGRAAIAVLSASALNDFLQTGFSYVRGKANQVAS